MILGAIAGIIFTLMTLNMGGCGTMAGIGKDIGDFASWVSDHHDNGWKRLDERTK